MHYFFLVVFCWMLFEGYQLYKMLIQVFEPNHILMYLYYFIRYALFRIDSNHLDRNYLANIRYLQLLLHQRPNHDSLGFHYLIIVVILSNIIVL